MSATPIAPFPCVLCGLLALRAQGTATGAVTLQDPDRLRWLLPPAVAELLDVVVTRQDARPEPAPDGLQAALSQLDVPPQRAVSVGERTGSGIHPQHSAPPQRSSPRSPVTGTATPASPHSPAPQDCAPTSTARPPPAWPSSATV